MNPESPIHDPAKEPAKDPPKGSIKDHPILVVLGLIVAAFIAGSGWSKSIEATLKKEIEVETRDLRTLLHSLTNELQSLKTTGSPTGGGLPIGSIAAYGGPLDTEPQRRALESAGWLLCDGSVLDKSEPKYKRLAEVIAPFWDASRANGKFTLPDLQGRFLRGLDLSGLGRDVDATTRTNGLGVAGNSVGSLQSDAFMKHTHPLKLYDGDDSWTMAVRGTGRAGPNLTVQGEGSRDAGLTSLSGGSAETRPKNAAVNWIIRFR